MTRTGPPDDTTAQEAVAAERRRERRRREEEAEAKRLKAKQAVTRANARRREAQGAHGWVVGYGCHVENRVRRLGLVIKPPAQDKRLRRVECPCGAELAVGCGISRERKEDEPVDVFAESIDALPMAAGGAADEADEGDE